MITYISILRGINVGEERQVLMRDLKGFYEQLGFEDIKTYIQSGNVLFKSENDINEEGVATLLERKLARQYHFEVPVLIRTLEYWEAILINNPFLAENDVDIKKLHVTFLAQKPSEDNVEKINTYQYPPDRFLIKDDAVFLHCPIDYGHTKLSNHFFETKLNVRATTRNWNTVTKLVALARAL